MKYHCFGIGKEISFRDALNFYDGIKNSFYEDFFNIVNKNQNLRKEGEIFFLENRFGELIFHNKFPKDVLELDEKIDYFFVYKPRFSKEILFEIKRDKEIYNVVVGASSKGLLTKFSNKLFKVFEEFGFLD